MNARERIHTSQYWNRSVCSCKLKDNTEGFLVLGSLSVKVAIDISPLKTGHSVRGIGSYTKYLVEEFKKGEFKNIEFKFFESPTPPPLGDVIHYPYFDLFFHTLPILKKSSRVVVTIHDVIPLVFPNHFPTGIKGNINFFLQKFALNNVDAVIFDSKTSKDDIVSKLSIPEEKIHVVYLAPSPVFKKISVPKKLSQVVRKYDLPSQFVLYVGDVNWSKNIQNLLEAVNKSEVNLIMVGKALADESLAEVREINNLINKLNIKDKVFRVGYIKDYDLVAIYNLAQVTVLPSYYEGFGLPVLESMACGTPVVCSNVASLKEIGQDAAIFCDPTDPNDISKKIDMISKLTTTQKEKTSQKLIKHASKFSWEKVAGETIKVYKSVSSLND